MEGIEDKEGQEAGRKNGEIPFVKSLLYFMP